MAKRTASPRRDDALLRYLSEEAWPLRETVLDKMLNVLARHVDGATLTADEVREVLAAAGKDSDDPASREPVSTFQDGVSCITVNGVIAKHASMVNGVSQPTGSSVQRIADDLAAAVEDPRVRSIMLRIESPGGSIGGLPELADAIREARKVKPVFAFCDDQACSAAYWLASQATAVYATQAAAVGSIGVYTVLIDSSKRAEAANLRFVKLRSGPYKGTGEPGTPITDDEIAPLQARIDALCSLFVQAVADGRGMDVDAVADLATGAVFTGRQAVENGLIDGIASYEQVFDKARRAAGDGSADPKRRRRGGLESASAHGSSETGLDEEREMADDKKTVTAAEIEAAKAQAATDALTAERARVAQVSAVLGAYPDVLQKALADGTVGEAQAQAMLLPVVQAQLADAQAKLADAETRLKAIATNGDQKPLAADADGGGDPDKSKKGEQPAAGSDTAAAYEAKVASLAKARGRDGQPSSLDWRDAAVALPDAHDAWKDANAVTSK